MTGSRRKPPAPPADDPPEVETSIASPLRGRLVLANGRTVAIENVTSTHHYDPQTGELVPVVRAYMVD